jgi:hypothetical protein
MTYDRAAIMQDAHKRFRDSKRLVLVWTRAMPVDVVGGPRKSGVGTARVRYKL